MKKKQKKRLLKLIDSRIENLNSDDLRSLVLDILFDYVQSHEFKAVFYKEYKKAHDRFIEDSYL